MPKPRAILALLVLLNLNLAAESLWLTSEKVFSDNGRFYASLCTGTTGTCSVEVRDVKDELPLWTTWIEWHKGFAAKLSDDGRMVAVINDVYSSEASLVTVYTARIQKAWSVKSIAIKSVYLKPRNNHLVWIRDIGDNARFFYDEKRQAKGLDLLVVDGRTLSLLLP